jgi:hypothetical protein
VSVATTGARAHRSRPPAAIAIAIAVAVAAGLLLPATVFIDQANAAEPNGESQQDELSRRTTDPTASPPNFAFISDVTFSYRDLEDGAPVDETGHALRFQPVVPFKAWGAANILRMTLPYQISGSNPEGLGDITVFNLVIVPQSWGRLGIGAVGSFSSATSNASTHASGGPAIGFVAAVSKKLNVGLFNQNLFGNDVAISQMQPIAAYQLGNGWALSLGDLQWPYDWHRDAFVSMPIGAQLGKVLPVAGQPMRFAVNPQYDLKDLPGNSRFKVLFTVTLLLPEGKK